MEPVDVKAHLGCHELILNPRGSLRAALSVMDIRAAAQPVSPNRHPARLPYKHEGPDQCLGRASGKVNFHPRCGVRRRRSAFPARIASGFGKPRCPRKGRPRPGSRGYSEIVSLTVTRRFFSLGVSRSSIGPRPTEWIRHSSTPFSTRNRRTASTLR